MLHLPFQPDIHSTKLRDYNQVVQEQVVFPGAPFDKARVQSMHRVFFWTHIALGISYYKAFCPPEIEILSGMLTEAEAAFFNRFYLAGLGEFAVRNGLNLQGKIRFPFGSVPALPPISDLKPEAYVAVGGKYLTAPHLAGSRQKTIEVLDELIERERQQRKKH